MARSSSFIGHSGLRRRVLQAGVSLFAISFPASAVLAQAWKRAEDVQSVLGGAPAEESGLVLELPLVSEDGSSVALSVRFEGSLEDDDFIQYLDVFALANPTPNVASFEFGNAMGMVNLALRVRLGESQAVVAVARSKQGKAFVAERDVRITTSGCIGTAARPDPQQEMQARVRLPKAFNRGKPAEVLSMITHPMDTGLVEAPSGGMIPQRIIQDFEATLDDTLLMKARFYRSLAANPYLRFALVPQESGTLRLRWVEDGGREAVFNEAINVS